MTDPDPTLPDTAMASGSDEGEPGERPLGGPLAPDEQRLLEQLEQGVDDAAPGPEAAAPSPADGGDQQDGLSAEFTEPDAE